MKTISTKATPSNIAQIIAGLAEAPPTLEALSRGRASPQLRQPLASGERSLAETLAHLIITEARSSEAIYLALLADEPLMTDLHPERRFGQLLRYDLLDYSDLLAYFALRRTVLLRVLNALTEGQWARSVREAGKQRQESVDWRARLLALHEPEHLTQPAA